MKKILVFGGSGMLGSMVTTHLATVAENEVVATIREESQAVAAGLRTPNARFHRLDASSASDGELVSVLQGVSWAINAIGIIKPYIRDDRADEVERAVAINAAFPHRLARAAGETGTRVIQIATDCVYSGLRGRYVEGDEHDPRDVYGKTKSLGEVRSPSMHHLRCSIIGPELKGHASLLDWFVRQPQAAGVKGFSNHLWNGVTTLQFARISAGIIRTDMALPHLVHVLPADVLNKADLLTSLARHYGRRDVTITPTDAATAVDRTLATNQPDLNLRLWHAAGYDAPPTIDAMIREVSQQ